MINRAVLANNSGLVILAASAALALACALVPQLATWSDMPPWLLLAGLVAYAGTVAVCSLRGASQEAVLESAELRAVRGIRNRLAALDLKEDLVGGTPTFARNLADTVSQLSERLIPALELLIQRHAVLVERLTIFEKQAELRPGEEVLSRLYAIEGRQRRAIADCVRQAADAEAALLAIAQEGGDEEHTAAEAEAWTTRLLTLHRQLVEVMRGEPA